MSTGDLDIRASIVDYLVHTANVPAELLQSGDVRLGDLNVDSLSAVDMLWTVETTYHVRLSDVHASLSDMTLDDLVRRFQAALAGSAAALPAGAP